MIVAIDTINKQAFGPFSTEEEGEAWVKDYTLAVEGKTDSEDTWEVHEVTHVVEDDHTFSEFTDQPGHCLSCLGAFGDGANDDPRVEVIDMEDNRRKIVHNSCYLGHDDYLVLAVGDEAAMNQTMEAVRKLNQ